MPHSFIALLLFLSVPNQLSAGERCRPIDRPDEDYRSATTTCSLGRLGTDTSSCNDANSSEAATFDIPLSVRTCIEWSCWPGPPESESTTGYPIVGFTGQEASSLIVSLLDRAGIAGIEIEPNAFLGSFPVVASFRAQNGEELVRIERTLVGPSGARLFAVRCDEPVIASVVIEVPPEALGFAIAFVRSDTFIPSLTDNPSLITGDGLGWPASRIHQSSKRVPSIRPDLSLAISSGATAGAR